MFERDGLVALMSAAKKRAFNAVLTESLSRLSRDQEDTAGIYKRLKFNEITIINTGGIVSDVHVGVGGIVNSFFLKNLSVSVTRGSGGAFAKALSPATSPMATVLCPASGASARSTPQRPRLCAASTGNTSLAGRSAKSPRDLNRDNIPSPAAAHGADRTSRFIRTTNAA